MIAESKTMRAEETPVSLSGYESHRPVGEAVADDVMARVARMTVAEIAGAVKVSGAMASRIARMAYEFPVKTLGLRAIEAFTGVVFREFDYASLSDEEKEYTHGHVRIISSLYGWLRPDDVIKPYRFDFTTRLAPGHRPFYEFWRKDVTIQLVRNLQEAGECEILNLLPGDAAKCVDWKLVKRFAKVRKVDILELRGGDDLRTPNAGKLKALRGELLRAVITRGLKSVSELAALETANLVASDTPRYADRLEFRTDAD